MHQDDAELVSAFVENADEKAFRTLVERHQERIYGFLLGMVREPTVADDLFQETFVKAVRAMQRQRGSYTSQGRWLQWVMRIARNTALDHLRSRKRSRMRLVMENEEGLDLDQIVADGEPDASDKLHRQQQAVWLSACIDRLPPEQREVVLMRHESELTFREIAELTDCSINTALGRMRYALLNLRRMLQETDANELERIELAS
ncbi:MAG TPA: sigma-70 family RNA polymerase sigma factor [Rhodothermales bacterium]|nr:sigma-70 family RNA polymerase sigma factor [Rhodothermales bacterium]